MDTRRCTCATPRCSESWHRASRGQLAQHAGALQPHRCTGDRRLGHGSAGRNRTPRLICEDRYQTRSTILTSQLLVARWHEQIGDPTAADGILDRLVHNAHRIEMRGDSMRKKRSAAS
ncbi:MAG: ATP-binding protein [Acidobacteriota bacterium]